MRKKLHGFWWGTFEYCGFSAWINHHVGLRIGADIGVSTEHVDISVDLLLFGVYAQWEKGWCQGWEWKNRDRSFK